MGIMAHAAIRRTRRKSRTGSGVSGGGDGMPIGVSNAGRQFSDGGASRQFSDGGASRQFSDGGMSRQFSGASRQFSDGGGERAAKSASAVAQEALTAGGALQTVEGREEGAVALKVRASLCPAGGTAVCFCAVCLMVGWGGCFCLYVYTCIRACWLVRQKCLSGYGCGCRCVPFRCKFFKTDDGNKKKKKKKVEQQVNRRTRLKSMPLRVFLGLICCAIYRHVSIRFEPPSAHTRESNTT